MPIPKNAGTEIFQYRHRCFQFRYFAGHRIVTADLKPIHRLKVTLIFSTRNRKTSDLAKTRLAGKSHCGGTFPFRGVCSAIRVRVRS